MVSDQRFAATRPDVLMVQAQSTWFPLVNRNPQTFMDIPTAKPGDFQAATQRVVRSRTQPSGVEVYVLPALGDGIEE
jgi:predicted acyl esterase